MKRVAPVLVIVLVLAATAALGHGASRGLHIHLEPEPATAGATLTVTLDAEEPIRSAWIGWVDDATVSLKPELPSRHVSMTIQVPDPLSDPVINLHAEVVTTTGKKVRAAAVLRISPAPRKSKNR